MRWILTVSGGPMLPISWRTNRRPIVAWVFGMVVVFAATAFSVNNLYGTPAELKTYAAATQADTAIYAINGRPYGLDGIGGAIAYEFAFIGAIAIPLMAIILATRMTRLEEQTGRMELVRAGAVGRTAALRAAAVLVVSAFLAMALGMGVVLAILGLSWPAVALYPMASALLGVAFAALTALAAQVVAYARTVTALGIAVLVISFVGRGAGDVRDNALVWVSPLGWAEQTRAFGDARWWPLLLLIVTTVAAYVAADRITERRDLGEGLVAQRSGNSQASAALISTLGLAARRHRNAIVGWSVIAALVGASFGSLGDAFATVAAGNATLNDILAGDGDGSNAFVSFVVILIALICMGFAISGVARAAQEEDLGRLEPMLAGGLSRWRWLGAHVVVLTTGLVLIAATGGLGLGIADALSTGDSSQVIDLVGATFAYLPAAALLLAIALALYGLRPRWLWAGWLPLVFVTIVAVLGDTLQLPDWVINLSPLIWVGRVPLEDASGFALAATAVSVALVGTGALGAFRSRDVPAK